MRQLTHNDYQGYGVYEFQTRPSIGSPHRRGGYGQFGLAIPGMMPDPSTMMVLDGGIQVAKSEYQDMALSMLDQTSFEPDGDENAPMVTGQANAVLGSVGAGWASEYLESGYAVMVKIDTVQSGSPVVMLANAPGYISDNAARGGAYAVVKAPSALLQAAKALVAGTPPPGVEPPYPGGVIDLDCPAGTQETPDGKCVPIPTPSPGPGGAPAPGAKAAAGAPEWMWPAVIAVGAVVLIAAVAAGKDK